MASGAKLRKKMEYNNLFRLFLSFTTKKGCILGLQPKKVVTNNEKWRQTVKLYLPTELDGLHWSVMPTAEGDTGLECNKETALAEEYPTKFILD